jgi:hypothetical protein
MGTPGNLSSQQEITEVGRFTAHALAADLHSRLMRPVTFDSTLGPDGLIQLLDDHHLVILSDHPRSRRAVGCALQDRLALIADTQVLTIDGQRALDLPGLCRQLEHGLALSRSGEKLWWRDVHSLIGLLRSACHGARRRYFIWQDADAMLEADVELFCRVVNAFCAVAAECEHVSLDPIVLLRLVFIGGPKLGAYAEDTTGQFCRWLDDDDDSWFWEVASIVDRPSVITYRIDG